MYIYKCIYLKPVLRAGCEQANFFRDDGNSLARIVATG